MAECTSPAAALQQGGRTPWLIAGVLMAATAILGVLLLQPGGGGDFEEVESYFPRATPEAISAWTESWHRRGDVWADVPDPPGEGPVVKARYWLARDRYDMEVRRRGRRFVVAIGGVAEHLYGGGWAAYGEGTITGDARDFRGAIATFAWSCLGLRYRHASDGVGRLVFSRDGSHCHTLYMAWEAPALWAKSYGARHDEDDAPPAYGALRGQIPIAPVMARLEDGRSYRAEVRVVDPEGAPLAGALVGLKGHTHKRVRTDAEGRARVAFRGSEAPYAQSFTAGRAGYRNGEAILFTGDQVPRAGPFRVEIELAGLDPQDDPNYVWQHPSGSADPDDVMACGTCHPWPYDEWYGSRHARMADHGHVAWEREQMAAAEPAAPVDCRGCHQPADALARPDAPWRPRGVLAGNHCDFCHKIQAVKDTEASGVFGAYQMLRPHAATSGRPGGIHTVFGPSPDVTYAYMGAAYNPLFETSYLCAGCHQGGGRGKDGGTPKIDTFEEWKRWSVEQADDGDHSCQTCHMPAVTVFDDRGRAIDQMAWDAIHRSPQEIHSHRFLGSDAAFARTALDLVVRKTQDADTGEWKAEVSITNRGAGHKIPTGTWSKHVVVGVWAERAGRPLRLLAGPRAWIAPSSAAPDAPPTALAPGDWNNPGGFVLGMRARDDVEEQQGLPRFWQRWPPEQLIDRRLAPGETRRATLRFEAGQGTEDAFIEVRVLYRRGTLPEGAASVPWTVGPNDPPPEVLWMQVRR